MKSVIKAALVGLALSLPASGAFAQGVSDSRVATMADWAVFVESNPTECWIVSTPKESVHTRGGRRVSVRRGDIYLLVTFMPSKNVKGQVSFVGGYPFAKNNPVKIEIDGKSYMLPAIDGEIAWPANESEDAKLVAAMKKGVKAYVIGQSQRGTITKDTFSLVGFTAAVEEAAKRCGG
ncbi:MAG: hypothetical protein D6688_09065 [Alphaproteobacteria bacterium]|nr:MAG: hypothetical protein D6688_09065 [Alphaproteobacteria bacterium]